MWSLSRLADTASDVLELADLQQARDELDVGWLFLDFMNGFWNVPSSVLRNEILKKERLTRDDPFDLRCAQSLFYEPPLARGGTTGACQDSDLRRRAGYKSERTRRKALIVLVRCCLGFPMAFHKAGGSSHGAVPWIRCRLELAKNVSTVFARKRWMKFGPVFFKMHIVLVPDPPSLVGMINHMASLEFALRPFLLCMWSLCVWASMCSVSLPRSNPHQ